MGSLSLPDILTIRTDQTTTQ